MAAVVAPCHWSMVRVSRTVHSPCLTLDCVLQPQPQGCCQNNNGVILSQRYAALDWCSAPWLFLASRMLLTAVRAFVRVWTNNVKVLHPLKKKKTMLTSHFCVLLCVSLQWWRWRATSRRACRARSEQPASRGQEVETPVSVESYWTDALSENPTNETTTKRSNEMQRVPVQWVWRRLFIGRTFFTRARFQCCIFETSCVTACVSSKGTPLKPYRVASARQVLLFFFFFFLKATSGGKQQRQLKDANFYEIHLIFCVRTLPAWDWSSAGLAALRI